MSIKRMILFINNGKQRGNVYFRRSFQPYRSNYFSDLVKKETGISAIKHIQQKVLDVAKERMFNFDKSISQISDEMGFQYPQHFTRWFKKMEGCTPNEYRNKNGAQMKN